MNPHRKLSLLAWETTRACRFACPHCRASAIDAREPGELTTEEGKKLLAEAAKVGPGIVILSGGEPLIREDLEELASAGTGMGHNVVIACNDAQLLTDERIRSLKKAGVTRFSFSLHSQLAEVQDGFLGQKGAFNQAILAFGRLLAEGVPFQINTTVLPSNFIYLPEMMSFVKSLRASAWHLFFVVNTGRAAQPGSLDGLDDASTEKVLEWAASVVDTPEALPIKITCAPQHARIFIRKGKKLPGHGRSCMAGDGFAFVGSHGGVKPCGYFDQVAGSVRDKPFDEIYLESPLFQQLRDLDKLQGNCGYCEFRRVCGGCRARALANTGNFLESDPGCRHIPRQTSKSGSDTRQKGNSHG